MSVLDSKKKVLVVNLTKIPLSEIFAENVFKKYTVTVKEESEGNVMYINYKPLPTF